MSQSKTPTLSAHQAFVSLQIAYLDVVDLIRWARQSPELEGLADCGDVAELICLNPDAPPHLSASKLFERVYKQHFAPAPSVAQREAIAKTLFMHRLSEVVEGACPAHDLCRMISPIELAFEYPKWLGDMYSICDSIPTTPDRPSCEFLVEAARAHLSALQSR